MDPLAHSLLGAALARTRLGRDRPLAMPVLVIAANAPDIDIVAYFWSSDAALGFRRGLTHGPIGLAILPLLVAWMVWVLGKRWREPPGAIARAGFAPLVALSYLAMLTHPVLDWLNTYGVRFLYPFDRRWFYGDTLFIVDPWVWLVLGAGVALSQPPGVAGSGRRANLALAGLTVVTTALLLATAQSGTAKALWFAGVGAIVAVRIAGMPWAEHGRHLAASACVVVFVLYAVVAVAGARAARTIVRDSLAEPIERWMVGPLPLSPARREVVVETPTDLTYGRFRWFGQPRYEWGGWIRPRPLPSPVLDAALRDPSISGFVGWVRFLWVEIDEQPDRWEVHLMDARYTLERGARFGSVMVNVPKQ